MKRLTMRQIAEHFNVSVAAVSKALNDSPDISDKLKAEIRQYSAENNYLPNFSAQSLKYGKTNTIGIVVAELENPVYNLILTGISDVLYSNGYTMLVANSREDIDRENNNILTLLNRKVDGMLIIPANTDNFPQQLQSFKLLKEYDVPFALMNRYFPNYPTDMVVSNDHKMSYMGTEYLISKGHKKILHFTTIFNTSSVQERIKGFKDAMTDAGLPVTDEDVFRSKRDKQSCFENTIAFFSKEENRKYTAISAYNDLMALQIIHALFECGLRVPEDVAVIGNDDIDYAETCRVPLTTVIQNTYEIGRISANLILNKISNKESENHYIIEPMGISVRSSV